jgi:hypothetical protein
MMFNINSAIMFCHIINKEEAGLFASETYFSRIRVDNKFEAKSPRC